MKFVPILIKEKPLMEFDIKVIFLNLNLHVFPNHY